MFPHLFSPLQVGSLTLKNRIVSSGHDTVMADHGLVGDQLVAYHEARAAGGVGLIVTQATAVHPSAEYTAHALHAYDDRCLPGLTRLASAVHAHDTAIVGQLFHGGREIMDSLDGSLPVALAPSVVPNERFHVMPRAMPIALIEEVVASYGSAAARFEAAGFDGVEIVASHGYLPAQFLNPRVNLRTDRYGGSDENRRRFLAEVIAAVRAAVSPTFVVGLRISIDEITPEGLTADDSLGALAALAGAGAAAGAGAGERSGAGAVAGERSGAAAGAVAAAGADGEPTDTTDTTVPVARAGELDYVSVVAGTSATLAGSDHIVPAMHEANAYTAPLAARAKAVVSIPVIVAGRINQPQEAEAVIAAGQADACAMTRALISDPLLPRKAAAGQLDAIRACVGCNQACIGHFHAGYPISCIQLPETGREVRYGRRVPTTIPRDVMVIGGGPGGLKAAAVAAERGHRVTLYEAARRVGGQVLLAEKLPGRAEFGGVVTNLGGEAERAGVRIVTGTAVDAALVGREAPDVVVVATGARPRRPPLELTNDPVVLDPWEILTGARVPDGPVVIADWRCDWIGLGLAELLARRGHAVTLGVSGYMPGQRLQQYVRDAMTIAALEARVAMVTNVRPFGFDGSAVFFQHVLTGEPVIIEGVASLVLAQGHEPVDELATVLAAADGGFGGELHQIGDCLAPRTVEEAVLEGLRVGSAI